MFQVFLLPISFFELGTTKLQKLIAGYDWEAIIINLYSWIA